MPNVKTAISLNKALYLQAEEIASSLKVSRSRVFAMALEEFVKRRCSDRITQQINEAYSNQAENEDRELARQQRSDRERFTGPISARRRRPSRAIIVRLSLFKAMLLTEAVLPPL